MDEISFYKTQSDPSATAEELAAYLEAIKEIQSGKVEQFGGGVESKAYLKNGRVYLKKPTYDEPTYSQASSSDDSNSFSSAFPKTMLLKSFGISIPRQILRTKVKPANYQYSVYEQAPGIFIDSELNIDQFIFYMKRKFGAYGPKTLVELNKDMCQFSVDSLKDRVINGEIHLPKAFRDFTILNMLGVFTDVHGGNIFYDQEKGYTFLDLNFTCFPEEIRCKRDLVKYIKTHSFFSTKYFDFGAFTKTYNCYPIIRPSTYDTFLTDALGYNGYTQSFEGYVYNGIILEQSFQMIKDYAKRFGIEKEEDAERYCNMFFEKNPRYKKFYMPLSDLLELYSLAESSGEFSQDFIKRIESYSDSDFGERHIFNITNGTPISKLLDLSDFKKAMATLINPEFDYSFINQDNAILENYGFSDTASQYGLNGASLDSCEPTA